MRKLLSFLTLNLVLFFVSAAQASVLYTKTYGDAAKPALIFVHGGPGFNSWDFELTTAQKLADEGFFVVVYDQRGQGRSEETDPKNFNYTTYSNDLKKMIDALELKNPTLIGHSHGGPIAINFDIQYPGVAKAIIFVGAPINFFGSMKSIFENCSRRYLENKDEQSLEYLGQVYYNVFLNKSLSFEKQVESVGTAFGHGMYCGLYKTSNPTSEEKGLRQLLKDNPVQGTQSGMMTAMPGFLQSEDYIRRNYVDHVSTQKGRFFGIYGDEDGLFTPIELQVIKSSIKHSDGITRFKLVKGSSHSVFIDQQAAFIESVKEFLN